MSSSYKVYVDMADKLKSEHLILKRKSQEKVEMLFNMIAIALLWPIENGIIVM